MKNTTDVNTKIRLLEERYSNIRKKAQLVEQNLIRFNKDFSDEIKALNEHVNDFRREISQLKDKVEIILEQVNEYARNEEVKVLAKYLEFINPSKFVTKDEVLDIIDKAINQKL